MITPMIEQFDEIRPYRDEEVRLILNRLLVDRNFINILAQHYFPSLTKRCPGIIEWLTGIIAHRKLKGVHDIHSFQEVIEPILSKVINSTTSQVTFSGLEQLEKGYPYLFFSNHRDIVLDPALVNYALYQKGIDTPRIAIGDNLLSRPFVSDLMRLNKSFIVKRSVTGRKEKLKAYKDLSAYIHHSIASDHSIWIAQSEGRAKDGNDRTDTAIIKMLQMHNRGKEKSFSNSIHNLHIMPVAISYEYDPCDQRKANELYNKQQSGQYQKVKNEDLLSIAEGIEGFKGHIHVAFGSELKGQYDTAADVAEAVNQQIYQHYKLHPSNFIAWDLIQKHYPEIKISDTKHLLADYDVQQKKQAFQKRLLNIPEKLQPLFLEMYARPCINHFTY